MGRRRQQFNIAKSFPGALKKRNRRGTDSGGGQTTCTVHRASLRGLLNKPIWSAREQPSHQPGRTNRPKSPNDRASTNQSLYLKKHAPSTLISHSFPDSHQQGVGERRQHGDHRTIRVLHSCLVIPGSQTVRRVRSWFLRATHSQADHGGSGKRIRTITNSSPRTCVDEREASELGRGPGPQPVSSGAQERDKQPLGHMSPASPGSLTGSGGHPQENPTVLKIGSKNQVLY